MPSILRDVFDTWRLRARYQKRVQQRLLDLTEQTSAGDEAGWKPISGAAFPAANRSGRNVHDLRTRARDIVERHPHAQNLLRILEIYVAGPGLQMTTRPIESSHRNKRTADAETETCEMCDRLWNEFLTSNTRHWSFREHARRAWRDGEAFVRRFANARGNIDDAVFDERVPGDDRSSAWPPSVRFVEPGQIDGTPDDPDSLGIVTARDDAETPIAYLRHVTAQQVRTGRVERIPANLMFHTRYGVDSNEGRGRTLLAPVLETLESYDRWLEIELQARRLQASIVLWRKVHGGRPVDEATSPDGVRRERVRPGTIVTTSPGTELEFLQPKTNFGDSVGLGRQLLLAIAAGVGVPEYMLTADASNANFASTMVAEGPAVKLFQALQNWLADELTRFWRWILVDAVERGLLPADVFDRVEPEWSFPTLVSRDRPAERAADVSLLQNGVLSRSEVARRDGVDPAQMERERADDAA